MAAVTVNTGPIENVNGAVREIYYPSITVVTTADTLAVGIGTCYALQCSNTSITNMTFSAGTVTFTGTAVAGTKFKITGH